MRQWATAGLTFAAITAWWLSPILRNLSTVIPGGGAGDNVTFVWNIWWMRYALQHSTQSFFFTPFLFYPAGVDLTLHTHTALPALIGALPSAPIAGQNIVIALHIYLNFFCTYALAHRLTHRALPSFVAALVFGTSSFVTAHLNGHFNLIAAWTLPVVALLTLNALENPSALRGVALGVGFAATAYTDYYLFVFVALMAGLLWLSRRLRVSLKGEPRRGRVGQTERRVLIAVIALLLLDALVIAAILILPGDRVDIGSIHMSIRSIRNPITAGWILVVVTAAVAACLRVRIETVWDSEWRGRGAAIAAFATTIILLSPLLVHAATLWRSGAYVSQAYRWRSGPGGIDLATFVLGHPFHLFWGDAVRALYERLHIDVIESSGWLPVAALGLAGVAIAYRPDGPPTAPWLVIGTVFMVWALGPWLTVFGRQTPLMLPALLLRFVPVVANARIPGRAIAVVYLALAMLAGIGFNCLISRSRSARLVGLGLALLLVTECLPSRPALYVGKVPPEYFALKDNGTSGAICEVPFGLRDGFGEIGSLDEAILLYQTVHQRPVVGGFIARLPPGIVREYETIPVVRSLLALSSGRRVRDQDHALSPRDAARALAATGIAYVVLDLNRATPELVRYVQSGINLHRIAQQDGRIFYAVLPQEGAP